MVLAPSSLEVPGHEEPASSASTVAGEPSIDEKTGDTPARDSSSIAKNDDTDSPTDSAEPDPEYPTGAGLAFIVIALILSIFLLSLDQVRWNLPCTTATSKLTIIDHCCNSDSEDHKRVQGSRQGWLVRRLVFHDTRRLSINV